MRRYAAVTDVTLRAAAEAVAEAEMGMLPGNGSLTPRRDRDICALKGRNYLFYWLGLVFYVLGHRAEYMTFAWITWEVAKDPLALGYLGLAQGVPLVLFQLCGGVLANRSNQLRLLLVHRRSRSR